MCCKHSFKNTACFFSVHQTQIVMYMPNYFFLNIYLHSLKTLVDSNCHLF